MTTTLLQHKNKKHEALLTRCPSDFDRCMLESWNWTSLIEKDYDKCVQYLAVESVTVDSVSRRFDKDFGVRYSSNRSSAESVDKSGERRE